MLSSLYFPSANELEWSLKMTHKTDSMLCTLGLFTQGERN